MLRREFCINKAFNEWVTVEIDVSLNWALVALEDKDTGKLEDWYCIFSQVIEDAEIKPIKQHTYNITDEQFYEELLRCFFFDCFIDINSDITNALKMAYMLKI